MTPHGVQNERTSLAWVRTALGLAGAALLTGRLAIMRGSPLAVIAALAAALLAFGALGWSHDRYRRTVRAERPADFGLPAMMLTAAIGLLGVLSLALIAS